MKPAAASPIRFFRWAPLVAYGVVIGLATALSFSLAEPMARVLGKTGIKVMTRLMGLILSALTVEVMADGGWLGEVVSGVARRGLGSACQSVNK